MGLWRERKERNAKKERKRKRERRKGSLWRFMFMVDALYMIRKKIGFLVLKIDGLVCVWRILYVDNVYAKFSMWVGWTTRLFEPIIS